MSNLKQVLSDGTGRNRLSEHESTRPISASDLAGANRGQRPDLLAHQYRYWLLDGTSDLYVSDGTQLVLAKDQATVARQAGIDSPVFVTPGGALVDAVGLPIVVSGGGTSAIVEYATHALLPGTATTGQTALVISATGIPYINRKPAGVWRYSGSAWVYIGEVPDGYFVDNVTVFFDDADPTKKLKLQLSAIATGTERTVTFPNKDGTLAMLSDITTGITDGDKGDVVVSGTGTVWTMDTAYTSGVRDRSTHTGTQSADTLTDGTTNKVFLASERTKLAAIAAGATANATDAALRDRSTHTGTQSADTLTTGTTNKVFPAASETKLAGIAAGATVNSSDAVLLARANHTGTQATSTVTGLDTALSGKQDTLVSGTNIKTVNSLSLLGSGNIVISGGGGALTDGDYGDVVVSGTGTVMTIDAAVAAADRARANHTGTQTADTVTDGTTNKAYTATEQAKLAGIAAGATANSTDALLKDRANHTGTQATSTITGLDTALTGKQATLVSATNIKTVNSTSLLGSGDIVIPAGPSGAGAPTIVTLAADSSNSTVTLANCTGMTFTAVANTTYRVELLGFFTSAAITTGVAAAFTIPSGVINGQGQHPISTTGSNSFEQVATGATTGATTGVRAAATNVPIWGIWLINIGATGGAVQLQWRSEVAASAVVLKAGAKMIVDVR